VATAIEFDTGMHGPDCSTHYCYCCHGELVPAVGE
jgi:hypothetical protein